jgi:ribonuclease HI
MNVDGSFVESTGEAGVGIVIRNSTGEVQLTAWPVLFRCASAEEAEAQTCAEGIRIAGQWCPGPMIIESDCSTMLKALEADTLDRSELRFIILEAKEYMQMLVEWKCHKVKRVCNKVAHELAHLARRNRHTTTWWRWAPVCVTDLLKTDCNTLPG